MLGCDGEKKKKKRKEEGLGLLRKCPKRLGEKESPFLFQNLL
jgi:hypothetical protein